MHGQVIYQHHAVSLYGFYCLTKISVDSRDVFGKFPEGSQKVFGSLKIIKKALRTFLKIFEFPSKIISKFSEKLGNVYGKLV